MSAPWSSRCVANCGACVGAARREAGTGRCFQVADAARVSRVPFVQEDGLGSRSARFQVEILSQMILGAAWRVVPPRLPRTVCQAIGKIRSSR